MKVTSWERREGEKADEHGPDAVAEERDRCRVTAERRHVVGDPSQRGDDIQQCVVARRVAITGRQKPYSKPTVLRTSRHSRKTPVTATSFCDE